MLSQPPASTPSVSSETVPERSAPATPPLKTAIEPKAVIEPHPKAKAEEPALTVPPQQSGGWGGIIVFVLVAILGGAGWMYRSSWMPYVESLLHRNKNSAAAKTGARTIPVVTAPAKLRDMDLYLNGLGTVTALKTATLRSRVEGELIKVTFSEGQIVKEGELLAEIDPRPFQVQLDNASGQLARDEATLTAAKLNLDRFEKLVASKAFTQQNVDDQRAIVEQTEGAIKTDKALVANAKLQLDYCRITAPFTGRIGLRLVDQGNIVRANDPTGIAVITQVEPISVVFTIPQDEIYRVQQRMKSGLPMKVDAFDRDFHTRLATGKLLATDNQVDPATGTLRLKALFEYGGDSALFPNQFVNTRLLVDTRQHAVVVPSAAVQRGPNFMFVYVVKADEKVEQRTVTVGPSEGTETIIEKGVQPGEIVVTDGIDKLQPGTQISTRETEEKKPHGNGTPAPAENHGRKKDAA